MADVLAAQLGSGRDVGASVGVYLDGRPVVEIWGGSADPLAASPGPSTPSRRSRRPARRWPSTALLILVDRGLVDLEDPVARYWPAFGQHGKAEIPVHLVLSHRSGWPLGPPGQQRPGGRARPGAAAHRAAAALVAAGTRHGYHAVSLRLHPERPGPSGHRPTVGQFFADEVARPLGLDLYIGLPPSQHDTVAPMVGPSTRQAISRCSTRSGSGTRLGVVNKRSAGIPGHVRRHHGRLRRP